MKIVILASLVALAASQWDQHADTHALMNQLQHYFLHVIDVNKDGATTVDEELMHFHQYDHGDCKMDFNEFKASRGHQHGPVHVTDAQIHAMFDFYDTRGKTQVADGFMTCDDVSYFFQYLDLNGDGMATEQEFEYALTHMAELQAQHITTTAAPATAPPSCLEQAIIR